MTAMFANSKIRGGVNTGYKTFRSLAWLNTDNERCGFATKFNKNMTFEDYLNTLLSVPMIFIKRDDEYTKQVIRDYFTKGYPKENLRFDFLDEEIVDEIIKLGITEYQRRQALGGVLGERK